MALSNVPAYVVCTRDGEGCSQTLHRNSLFPINPNIKQGKMDKPMAGVGNTTSPTPVPPVDSVPADAGPSKMVTPSTAGSTPQGSLDWPASLRHNTRTSFHGGTRILVCWQILDWMASGMHGLACISVCILYFAYTPFSWGVHCKMHSTHTVICLSNTTHFNIQENTLNATSEVECWAGKGVDQRRFGLTATPLLE